MKRASLIFLVLTISTCAGLPAQTFSLTTGREPVTSLDGLWRFHPGDNPAWADPNFDDSQWPLLRSDRDWNLQGYKSLSGFAWYRFAVDVPGALGDISITLPRIDDAYEVYANGSLIGSFGKLPPHSVSHSRSGLGKTFKLPRSLSSEQRIQFAIRVWFWDVNVLQSGGGPDSGRSLIGASGEVQRQNATYVSAILFHYSPGMIVILLEILAAFGAFTLFYQRRSEREYLWFGILVLSRAAYDVAIAYQDLAAVRQDLIDPIRVTLTFVFFQLAEVYFYLYLLKGKRNKWFRYVVVNLLLMILIAIAFIWPLPGLFNVSLHIGITILSIPYYIWVLNLVFKRARERYMDARLLLAPAVLQKLAQIWNRFGAVTWSLGLQHRFGLLTQIVTEPVRIDLMQLVNAIFLLAVFVILIRRFTRTRGLEEQYASEFAAARSVQQFLIPEHLPRTPGLAIESEYRPANEVGGDFFQVLPDAADGSVLIVVGDVAGHGLEAGMLATLIVGAIRTAASFTTDPEKILSLVNERMHGRGLATCLALRIERDGHSVLANGGHLPPYLNGQELAIEGALPLGALSGISFPILKFKLSEGDALMLMTDGVAEAQDAEGRLFGFERIGEMLRKGVAAAELATAAQHFGQEDDITVLTVARSANIEVAIA